MNDFRQIFQWILVTSFACILSLFLSTISLWISKVFWDLNLVEEVRRKNNSAALVLLGLLLMIGGILGFSLLGIQHS